MESETVLLTLTLSKPRKVEWFNGSGKRLTEDNERFRATVSSDGLEHTLKISDLTMDDDRSVFTATAEDNEYASVSSSCTVSVKG